MKNMNEEKGLLSFIHKWKMKNEKWKMKMKNEKWKMKVEKWKKMKMRLSLKKKRLNKGQIKSRGAPPSSANTLFNEWSMGFSVVAKK